MSGDCGDVLSWDTLRKVSLTAFLCTRKAWLDAFNGILLGNPPESLANGDARLADRSNLKTSTWSVRNPNFQYLATNRWIKSFFFAFPLCTAKFAARLWHFPPLVIAVRLFCYLVDLLSATQCPSNRYYLERKTEKHRQNRCSRRCLKCLFKALSTGKPFASRQNVMNMTTEIQRVSLAKHRKSRFCWKKTVSNGRKLGTYLKKNVNFWSSKSYLNLPKVQLAFKLRAFMNAKLQTLWKGWQKEVLGAFDNTKRT